MTAAQRSRAARRAANLRHYRDRIVASYLAASDADREAGARWYARAESECARIAAETGFSRHRIAAVIAVLSPRTRWAENIRAAESAAHAAARALRDDFAAELCGGMRESVAAAVAAALADYGLRDPIRKAGAILAGSDPAEIVSGPKVSAFFANLCGDRDAVTVDVWAQRVACGKWQDRAPAGAQYETLADAYRAAARVLGVDAVAVQAAVWVAIRGAAE